MIDIGTRLGPYEIVAPLGDDRFVILHTGEELARVEPAA